MPQAKITQDRSHRSHGTELEYFLCERSATRQNICPRYMDIYFGWLQTMFGLLPFSARAFISSIGQRRSPQKRLKTAHANIIPTNHVRRRVRVRVRDRGLLVRVRVRVRVRVNMQLFQQSNVRQCHA